MIKPTSREDLREQVLQTDGHILINADTGVGKTKIALEKIAGKYALIVVPRKVNIQTWKDEMDKWKLYPSRCNIITYMSLRKEYTRIHEYEYIVFDEAHHLNGPKTYETFLNMVPRITADMLFLTATMPRDVLNRIQYALNNSLIVFKYSMSDAISNKELPDLTFNIYYITPDDKTKKFVVGGLRKYQDLPPQDFNTVKGTSKILYYPVSCTEKEVVEYFNTVIPLWSNELRMESNPKRIKWKQLNINIAGTRRKNMLSQIKLPYLIRLLNRFFENTDEKAIIFVNNVANAQKIKESFPEETDLVYYKKGSINKATIERFNNDELRAVIAMDMLDEGVNLKSPDNVFILHMNRSVTEVSRRVIQRIGRGVRSTNPKIHILITKNSSSEYKDLEKLKYRFMNNEFKKYTL